MSYTIKFNIEYITQWGEELRVQLRKMEKGGKLSYMNEIALTTDEGKIWSGETKVEGKDVEGVQYLYAMYRDGELVWTEWEVAPHRLMFSQDTYIYDVRDTWRPIPEAQPELLFFCLFQSFVEKEYQTESKRNETFGNVIFGTNMIQRTWILHQETKQEAT